MRASRLRRECRGTMAWMQGTPDRCEGPHADHYGGAVLAQLLHQVTIDRRWIRSTTRSPSGLGKGPCHQACPQRCSPGGVPSPLRTWGSRRRDRSAGCRRGYAGSGSPCARRERPGRRQRSCECLRHSVTLESTTRTRPARPAPRGDHQNAKPIEPGVGFAFVQFWPPGPRGSRQPHDIAHGRDTAVVVATDHADRASWLRGRRTVRGGSFW